MKDSKSVFKRILKGTGIILGLGLVAGIALVFWVFNNLPPLQELENPSLNLSTQIYTADGKLLGNFFEVENRVYMPVHKISPHVLDALVATEDIRFYEHNGIDPQSFPAIAWGLIRYQRMRGGSTITMQLARNLYDQVGKERTAFRKLKEMVVSAFLERKFTKQEIIEAYLNTTCFYGNTYGIEMGSRTLFGKSAIDLKPHEAALMVGLLQNPTYHNPRRYPERAVKRRNTVISQMEKYELIDRKTSLDWKRRELELDYSPSGATSSMSTYFKQEVRRFLKDWAENSGKDVDLYADGLKVHTTIDSRMQAYAEEAVQEHLPQHQEKLEAEWKRTGYPWVKNPKILDRAMRRSERWRKGKTAGKSERKIKEEFEVKKEMRVWTWSGTTDTVMSPKDSVLHYLRFLETGFMAMDPGTGHVKAWVGGINYRYFQYDHVSQSRRQVGSTFKPFVYTAAFDRELIRPCDPVLDQPVTIRLPDGKKWTPSNSGGKDDGLITYVEGLAMSKNRVTASVMKQVGPEAVCEYARKLGIESELDCVPSLCLGTTDLTVEEMVTAYCVFANGGYRREPVFITRIEDRNGNIMEDFAPPPKQVINEYTAYTMVNMLMNVVDHPRGTGQRLRSTYKFENQMGGKTGTTQNQSDGWFMGITPNLVGGVWVGAADREVRFRGIRYGQGAAMALPIWGNFLQKIYADRKLAFPQLPFPRPEGYSLSFACPAPKDDTKTTTDDAPWM